MTISLPIPLAISWPLQMEFISGPVVSLMFLAGAAIIVLLGIRSLAGLGPVRKWVAIGVRCTVLLLALLILAGVRWTTEHKDLEIMVLRDISESTDQVRKFPGSSKSLQTALDNYFNELAKAPEKKPGDRIGVLSFHQDALIDTLPSTKLALDARGIREVGNGTDPAAAIQLALASMSNDAMRRLLLVWDGNLTSGSLESALATAAAQHVQIDVMPLRYDVTNEVLMDRFIAPTWKRENEPFTLEVIIRSTNAAPVGGKLTVLHQGEPMDLDPTAPGRNTVRDVTLKPGLNRELIRVPGNLAGGVHQFRAIYEGAAGVSIAGSDKKQGDTLSVNNVADAFTFVQGKGQILYVDAVRGAPGAGDTLPKALAAEGINLMPISVDQFPTSLVQLSGYDAVVLANVSRAALGEERQEMLAAYVHDQGGGLVMIGGEDTFGAGGWEGSKLEEVLPVDMDIPAQRQVGKGALAVVMHSSEMPNGIGNYWGMQCALKAAEALSDNDEVAVITFGSGGSTFDYPLSEKGDGARVSTAIKKMVMGDMPSFDESMNLAINGNATQKGLKDSNARHKHIITISDGDPSAPQQALIDQCKQFKISISTVTVYPHMGQPLKPDALPDPNGEADNPNLPETMKLMARSTGGRAYGPIDKNPNQLPQIFIKEATVVRRSLIHEADSGIPLVALDGNDEFVKGLTAPEPLFGMVLTSKKNDPKVMMPIAAQTNKEGILDPVLAHWQTGLGRAAVFTGDAHNKWGARWVASSAYSKFWSQVVRGVARPPMSTDFDVQTTQTADKGKVVIEAMDKDDRFLNFLSMQGTVLGPDNKPIAIRPVQTAPGRYEAEFPTLLPGNYVVSLQYADREGKPGQLLSGVAMNASPELRDLKSNESRIQEVAKATGGRVIEVPFDVASAQLFRRDGLWKSSSPKPIWDWLVPFLLGMVIVDVAVRRIAWDWNSIKRMSAGAAAYVRSHTTVRRVETRSTVDALAGIKQKTDQTIKPEAGTSTPLLVPRPDPKMKFEAKGDAAKAEGDITSVVGGATNKAVPPAPKNAQPKGMPGTGEHLGGLMAAKKRAQQQIREKEQGDTDRR